MLYLSVHLSSPLILGAITSGSSGPGRRYNTPLLVDIEADDYQLDATNAPRSASSASSAIDIVDEAEASRLSEVCSRHIARVAEQRARCRRNPPPRNRTVYTCDPCVGSLISRKQLSFHDGSGRHARERNRLQDLAARFHYQLCNFPFADCHNFEFQNRSRIHFRNARRQQEARLN